MKHINSAVKVPYFNATRQYEGLKHDLEHSVLDVMGSGQYILGEPVKHFESDFANYCGSKYAVGVGSGTDALILSLRALGIGKGDEVIVPSYTYSATVFSIMHHGAVPVFCDVDDYFTAEPESIASRITKRTKAILPVHLYGQTADMKAINKIAKQYGLHVIEDTAQAHGATLSNKIAGSFSDAGCFSFYPTKNLGAFGDGGAILTNSQKTYETLLDLRNLGHKTAAEPHKMLGWTSRLDNLQAAVLKIKLSELDSLNQKRRDVAEQYRNLLKKTPLLLPKVRPGAKHVYHLFIVQAPNGHREKLREFLQKNGIPTMAHYHTPVHKQPFYTNAYSKKWNLPVTDRFSKTVMAIPMFPELTRAEIKYVAMKIHDYFGINHE